MKEPNELVRAIESTMSDILNETTPSERKEIAEAVFLNFLNLTRKKEVPDMAQRVERMKADIQAMCQVLTFTANLEDSRVIIAADGPAGDTLLQLTRGTDWFEGRDIGDDILRSMAGTSS